ncbi:hypothetical protein [Azohydromonas australica]|uniref:hypothetical protein n=1 Tax=Azohydromonas australica TaxID=364039 RepID=UPI00040B13F5|nr:hypothetical protein [Azohydromonas australica]
MLDAFRQWFSRRAGLPGERALADWAHAQGHHFKRSRDADGFIVEAQGGAWRLEWGPSQRRYITGQELRLRAPLNGGAGLQLLVLTRSLLDLLEKQVFEQYTQGLQTRIDLATPDEMRWLVLHPKLPAAELSALRGHFGAVGHPLEALSSWIGGPLGAALVELATARSAGLAPLMLIVQRERLTLRTALEHAEPALITELLQLFEVARREAQRVAAQWQLAGPPDPAASLWPHSVDGPDSQLR